MELQRMTYATRSERDRRYYDRNKKKIAARRKARREKNLQTYREQLKAYRDSKPELVRKWRDTYNAKRRAN